MKTVTLAEERAYRMFKPGMRLVFTAQGQLWKRVWHFILATMVPRWWAEYRYRGAITVSADYRAGTLTMG